MLRKLVLPALLFALCSPLLAQETKENTTHADSSIALSESERPQFRGGDEALLKYVKKHLEYPERARKKKIEGTVVVAFLIDEKGDHSNFRIVKSLDKSCDAAALKVLREMPRWKPATFKNKAVATEMQMPVVFKLDNTLILENNKRTKNKYR